MNKRLLSIILSFKNEEETIPELIRRLENSLKLLDIDYEILFVDDASTDNSKNILIKERERNPGIKIITTSRSFGIDECIMAGLVYAKGEAAVFMDTDLQDPPELLPELITHWLDGADVVHTIRKKREGEPFVKMFLTKLAYNFLYAISDVKIPVEAGEYKLISRRVIDELLKMNEPIPYLRGLIPWLGFRQDRVYYNREKRAAGDTHFKFFGKMQIFHGPFGTLLNAVTTSSSLPLLILIFIGICILPVSFLPIIAIFTAFATTHTLSITHLLLSFIILLGGLILFSLSIISLYIARLMINTRTRPNFIVKETIGIN